MAEFTRLTLATIPFDLQIAICKFLRSIDILALRKVWHQLILDLLVAEAAGKHIKTCKTFELTTRQRVVWVAALHQVCLDNTLFLPSFPIPDMSDLELEQAAIAPHRWNELFVAFRKQQPNHHGAMLCPRTTRIIRDVISPYGRSYLFLVPGGRYLVVAKNEGLSVWDLGYVSSAHCTLIASGGVGLEYDSQPNLFRMVQATPDGMGLIILVFNRETGGFISIYEIYPQSKTPLLTQIAHLDFNHRRDIRPCHLLPDTLIFRDFEFYEDRIVFRVWDFRVNYSTCFSPDVKKFEDTFVTKTAIIILCVEGILVWAIPPLLPHSADHFLDNHPTCLPPLFRIPFPDGIVYDEGLRWNTISSWYFGSWESIYFDILRMDSFDRFKLIIKPDLSVASLHFINTFLRNPHNIGSVFIQNYRICEDSVVSFWSTCNRIRVYSGLTSADFTGDIPVMHSFTRDDLSLCPTSGRFVYISYGDDYDHDRGRIVVVDFIRPDEPK